MTELLIRILFWVVGMANLVVAMAIIEGFQPSTATMVMTYFTLGIMLLMYDFDAD